MSGNTLCNKKGSLCLKIKLPNDRFNGILNTLKQNIQFELYLHNDKFKILRI